MIKRVSFLIYDVTSMRRRDVVPRRDMLSLNGCRTSFILYNAVPAFDYLFLFCNIEFSKIFYLFRSTVPYFSMSATCTATMPPAASISTTAVEHRDNDFVVLKRWCAPHLNHHFGPTSPELVPKPTSFENVAPVITRECALSHASYKHPEEETSQVVSDSDTYHTITRTCYPQSSGKHQWGSYKKDENVSQSPVPDTPLEGGASDTVGPDIYQVIRRTCYPQGGGKHQWSSYKDQNVPQSPLLCDSSKIAQEAAVDPETYTTITRTCYPQGGGKHQWGSYKKERQFQLSQASSSLGLRSKNDVNLNDSKPVSTFTVTTRKCLLGNGRHITTPGKSANVKALSEVEADYTVTQRECKPSGGSHKRTVPLCSIAVSESESEAYDVVKEGCVIDNGTGLHFGFDSQIEDHSVADSPVYVQKRWCRPTDFGAHYVGGNRETKEKLEGTVVEKQNGDQSASDMVNQGQSFEVVMGNCQKGCH